MYLDASKGFGAIRRLAWFGKLAQAPGADNFL